MTTSGYKYPDHSDWCAFLAELGTLKESHNACIDADRCMAEDDE
jgi:hypothetical protein